MKVHFKGSEKYFNEEQKKVLKLYTKMLQRQMPLKKDVHVYFVDYRKNDMTTGLREPHHEIYVLTPHRMLVDVMRTYAHEWGHEYEHQKLGFKDKNIERPQIGTPAENLANILAGIMTKKFDNEYPEYKKLIYDEG